MWVIKDDERNNIEYFYANNISRNQLQKNLEFCETNRGQIWSFLNINGKTVCLIKIKQKYDWL